MFTKRLKIFVFAFFFRVIIGCIFYGSIDLANNSDASQLLMAGNNVADFTPYFPLAKILILLGGLFSYLTPFPFALGQKLIPIFFDSLIAVLIYDILNTMRQKTAYKAALLYALMPVAIIINSIHAQLDSIPIFFLLLAFSFRDLATKTWKHKFLFGVFFVISFLIKPFTLIFLLIFFPPLNNVKKTLFGVLTFVKEQIPSLAGFLITLTGFFILFQLMGYDNVTTTITALKYGNSGVQIFGLPLTYPFNLLGFMGYRFWILGTYGVFVVMYYLGKFNVFEMILFFFLMSLGLTGIAPQYLIWPVALMLIISNFKISAIYNFITTIFLVLYYSNPNSSIVPWENMGTFGTLNSYRWLMPQINFLGFETLYLVKLLGNYAIPIISMATLLFVALNKKSWFLKSKAKFFLKPKIIQSYIFLIAIFALIVISVYGLFRLIGVDNSKVSNVFTYKKSEYNLKIKNVFLRVDRQYLVGNYTESSPFNIGVILILASIFWLKFATYD